MSKKKAKKLTQLEIYKRVRRSWGEIDPRTKVVPSKKKLTRAKTKAKTTKSK